MSFLLSINPALAESSHTLRLATTTSVENSGLLTYLMPHFKIKHPYEVDVSIVGSGKALRLGRTGAVDVVWVHSPASEMRFVEEGFGVNHHTVMRNDFVIAGPKHDPAKIADSADVLAALKKISDSNATFISRADDSGTNKKEISLWKKLDYDPVGEDWYIETGSGMAESLKTAEKQQAYIMVDRATFVVRHGPSFKILIEDPDNLSNPYSVVMVNPEKHSATNTVAAGDFITWISSDAGKSAIESFQHNNQQLYFAVDSFK
ncbi:MAG: substrate-binding domain-containing protein [Gammaproteobacteria bacterium]